MSTNQPTEAETQPLAPARRAAAPQRAGGPHRLLTRGRWLPSLVIAFTSCTLMITMALFVSAIPSNSEVDGGGRQVGIHYAGVTRQLTTSAETVGALLAEQGIELSEAEALAPAASENLTDGMVVTVLRNRTVTIEMNGAARELRTVLEKPLAILNEAGINVSDSDRIWVNGALANFAALSDWTVPALHIIIRRASRLTIIDDGDEFAFETAAETVGDALYEAGVTLYMTDELSPPLDSAVTGPMTIRITRAIPLILHVDGIDIAARTNTETVSEVLSELNAPLFGLDYVRPPGDTAIEENMRIEIVRVTEEVVAESEVIKHSLQYRPDSNLHLDARALVQEGRDGRREIRYRIRYENGIEVSREHTETVVVETAVNRIVAYGTNIVPLGTVGTPAGPRQYWRRLCVYITSYNPASNGGNLNTATGAQLAKGIIAAKPNIIPYYTQLYVPDYGLGVVRDTGGGPSGTDYWVDLGYGPNDTYVRWRAYRYVYLLMPPPSKVPYRLPAWTPNSNWVRSC